MMLGTIVISGCFSDTKTSKKIKNTTQLGKITFEQNCALCHGKQAQGLTKDWRQKVNGKYPAPPLNGTAHTWHHSPALLLRIINNGSLASGGSMPGFKNSLSKEQKKAVLNYIYNLWPAEIQEKYTKNFRL